MNTLREYTSRPESQYVLPRWRNSQDTLRFQQATCLRKLAYDLIPLGPKPRYCGIYVFSCVTRYLFIALRADGPDPRCF